MNTNTTRRRDGTGTVACLGATAWYGAALTYTRRSFLGRKDSAAAVSAAQVGTATLELAVVAAAASISSTLPSVTASIALVVLDATGTAYAFLFDLQAIRPTGPTVAPTIMQVEPIWYTIIEAALLAEPVGWSTLLCWFLMIGGILVARTTGAHGTRAGRAS